MKSARETRRDHNATTQSKKPQKGEDPGRATRPAFGDLTNATQKNAVKKDKDAVKKVRQPVETKVKPTVPKTRMAVAAQAQKTRKPTTAPTTTATTTQVVTSRTKPVTGKKVGKKTEIESEVSSSKKSVTSSQESVSSSQEFAVSSSQDCDSSKANVSDMVVSDLDISERDHSRMSLDQSGQESPVAEQEQTTQVPVELGVEDIDKVDLDDLSLAALYAHDVFLYYKEREVQFKLNPYMARQPQVTQRMRAVLVDWLVEVQENFELNHETLYLAVKLVDTYLAIVPDMSRDNVQLVGAVALFLSSKFDERMPPAIDDFIYICDHAYDRDQFMAMERELFSTVGFDLGRPISYRFLRRYAKCGRSETKTLYLARFLLELSLMEYKFVFQRESIMAAASLYIARKMRHETDWTPTLVYYTGYTVKEMKPLIVELNNQFTNKRHADLSTIRDKYRHPLFHSVAEISLLSPEELFSEGAVQAVVRKGQGRC